MDPDLGSMFLLNKTTEGVSIEVDVFLKLPANIQNKGEKMNAFRTLLFMQSDQHDHHLKGLAALTKISANQLVEMTWKFTWQSW